MKHFKSRIRRDRVYSSCVDKNKGYFDNPREIKVTREQSTLLSFAISIILTPPFEFPESPPSISGTLLLNASLPRECQNLSYYFSLLTHVHSQIFAALIQIVPASALFLKSKYFKDN